MSESKHPSNATPDSEIARRDEAQRNRGQVEPESGTPLVPRSMADRTYCYQHANCDCCHEVEGWSN